MTREQKLLQICRAAVRRSSSSAAPSGEEPVSWEAAKPYESLPGHRILPFIGTGWTLLPLIGRYKLDRQHHAAAERKRLFGDVLREKIGRFDVISSSRAEDMEIISRNEGKYPSRGGLQCMQRYRESRKDKFKSLGILILEGPEWLEQRQKIQKHMLKPQAAEGYMEATQSVAVDFVGRMKTLKDADGEIPNLQKELYKWALESIAYVGLDSRLGCLASDLAPDSDGLRMIESVLTQFECMYRLEFTTSSLFWKHFRTPTWRKYESACDVFVDIAFKYITKAVEDLKSGKVNPTENLTVLQALLLRENMDPSEAVAFLSDMLMAGIETTSNTVAFFLYNMAKFPEKQELLYEELKKFFPTRDHKMTNEIFPNLRYLKASLKESMRYTPTVGGMLRVLAKDSVIGGYRVAAGTFAVSGFMMIFRDARYFERPDEFEPERWLHREEGFNPFAYVPFGFGTRSCIGRRIAEMEMICVIAEIIRNFRVEYHHEDIGMYTRFVNTPDKPLRYKFIQR